MLKTKRLHNLCVLKTKFLNTQKKEINTLSIELQKCNTIKKKLLEIVSKIENKTNTSASALRENSKFNLKILEQITIADNRIKFLEVELKRSKNNLGKLIKQKERIENKLSVIAKNNLALMEKKYLDTMPPQRNV